MKQLLWTAHAALFYLFTLAVSSIPENFVPKAGRLAGQFMFHLLAGRRRVAIDNIRQSLRYMQLSPDWTCDLQTPEEIAREVFHNIGTSLVETCRLYQGKGENLLNSIEIRGREHYEAAKAQGKGIILLTGHCGNWELAALAFSHVFNAPMSVVARRQDNPYLNTMVEKMRNRYQNRIIYKDNAMRNMISVIRKNGIIGLLVDQAVFPEEGAMVSFLGRTAWSSKAPVVMARKTGAVILPIFPHREAGRHVITVYPACHFEFIDTDEGMAADVQHYSEYFEHFIIDHPTDWYWVHRRWKRAGEKV